MRLQDLSVYVRSKIKIINLSLDQGKNIITVLLLMIISIFSTKFYFEKKNLLCAQNEDWEKTQDELHQKLAESENQKNLLQQQINTIASQSELIVEQSTSEEQVVSKININTATETELDKLPGIGPVYANRIVEYRQLNNGFKSLEELKNIKGIGEKTFEKLKDLISL